MALINCLGCSAQISDKAINCPRCGLANDMSKRNKSENQNQNDWEENEYSNKEAKKYNQTIDRERSQNKAKTKESTITIFCILLGLFLDFYLWWIADVDTFDDISIGVYLINILLYFTATLSAFTTLISRGKTTLSQFLLQVLSILLLLEACISLGNLDV